MGQYDIRQFAKDEVKTKEAAFWDAWSNERDETRKENRYQEEKLTEQTRYDSEQENLMFQQKQTTAENEYNQAVQEYQLAYEQIGKHNPAMLEKLQTQFGKEYKIPRRDGTFETRYVVPKSVREFTSGKVKSEVELDKVLDNWKNLSPSEKTAAWPEIKKVNRYFTRDLSDIEASAKRAMSHEDNAKLLDTMGNFLPAGYDTAGADGISKWTKAKDILLQDKEVSEAELKIIAGDISSHIATREDAKKFWTDWNTNIMENMSKLGPEDATVIGNLQRMQEIVLPELDKYYPGASGRTSTDNDREKTANKISQKLWGVDFEELTDPEKQKKVFEEFQKLDASIEGEEGEEGEEEPDVVESSFIPRKGLSSEQIRQSLSRHEIPKISSEKEKKPWKERMGFDEYGVQGDVPKFLLPESPGHRGRDAVKDPVDLQYKGSKGIAIGVRLSPFTYANKGIIPSDKSPGYKKVSIKEALQHYQKNKSKYKKDKPIKAFQGLFRDRKDLTQYPE